MSFDVSPVMIVSFLLKLRTVEVLEGNLNSSSSKVTACRCIMFPILKLNIQSSFLSLFIPN